MLKASRPLFIERADYPDFPYFKVGSATVCRFAERHYAVLARHTIRAYTADQIRIPLRDGARSFFAYDCHWLPFGEDDRHDITVLRISTMQNHDGWFESVAGLSDDTVNLGRLALDTSRLLLLSGYPGYARNEIDYEAGPHLRIQRALMGLGGVGPSLNGVRQLRLRGEPGGEDLGGFSGSPVLCNSAGEIGFCGLVIQASGSSGIFHIVDGEHVLAAVKEAARECEAGAR